MKLASAIRLLTSAAGFSAAAMAGQTVSIRATPGHPQTVNVKAVSTPATAAANAAMQLRLVQTGHQSKGELWLELQASTSPDPGTQLTLRIPLSSTGDVYGESRACTTNADGSYSFTFTAGMDETNFLPFATSSSAYPVRLLLNKYLCRALAAPFHCGAKEVAIPADWEHWILATHADLSLSSSAPAGLVADRISVQPTGESFDPASCPRIAPSTGMCCVGGKATEWHCGRTPAGPGWHQVSGECFHRATGGTCTDQTVFPLNP